MEVRVRLLLKKVQAVQRGGALPNEVRGVLKGTVYHVSAVAHDEPRCVLDWLTLLVDCPDDFYQRLSVHVTEGWLALKADVSSEEDRRLRLD